MQFSPSWSLAEIEQRLAAGLAGKTLIGELELDEEDVALLADHLQSYPIPYIWNRVPYSAACLTAGVFANYWDNNFWTPFCQHFRCLSEKERDDWRWRFIAFLRSHDLPDFAHCEGQRMIKRVRIHAGLTYESGRRVFEHVVRPGYQRDVSWGVLTAGEIVADLGVDCPPLRKPEHEFLVHGSYVADEFLQRCFELYSAARAGDDIAHTIDLPHRVVEAFRDWWEGQKVTDAPATRLAQPYLRLSLDHAAVVLVVPPRAFRDPEVTLRVDGGADSDWQIEKVLPVSIFTHRTAEERDWPLEDPSTQYRVGWRGPQGSVLGAAAVRGLWAGNVPWMAFAADDEEGRGLTRRVLPRGTVWVVAPVGTQAQGTTSAADQSGVPVAIRDEFEMPGWEGFCARLIDTVGLTELRLHASGETERIPVDLIPSVRLEGCLRGVSMLGYQVCTHAPTIDTLGLQEEIVLDLLRLDEHENWRWEGVVAPTELAGHLASRIGVFRVTARGRLGRRSASQEFAIFPGLSACFSRDLYPPGYGEEVVLTVAAEGTLRKVSPQDYGVRVAGTEDTFRIIAPGDSQLLHLLVVADVGGEPRQVQVAVEVPRLLLASGSTLDRETRYGPDLLVIPREAVGREVRSLFVRVHPSAPIADVVLRSSPGGWRLMGQGRASSARQLHLEDWYDALRATQQHQSLYLDLMVDGLPISAMEVGRIVAHPALKQIAYEFRNGAATLRYEYCRNSTLAPLRLVSATYPWVAPQVLSGVRDYRGQLRCPDLTPGTYFVEPEYAAAAETDVLPAPSPALEQVSVVTMGSPYRYHGAFDELLREVAGHWDLVWPWQRGHGWSFDDAHAIEALRGMPSVGASWLRHLPHGGLREQDVRCAVLLMLYWGQRTVASGEREARDCWASAVKSLISLLPAPHREFERQLDALTRQALPTTRELCRQLRGLVAWSFGSHKQYVAGERTNVTDRSDPRHR